MCSTKFVIGQFLIELLDEVARFFVDVVSKTCILYLVMLLNNIQYQYIIY